MGYNENLALLYNEAKNSKDKEKLFLKIKNNVEDKTKKVIAYRVNRFSWKNSKKDDFENFYQIADEVLLNTILITPEKNNEFNLEKWYIERLKNELWDIHRDRVKKEDFDIGTDYQDDRMESLIFKDNTDDIELDIDNKNLYNIILLYINKINLRKKYSKKQCKDMFLKSIGFTEDKIRISYEDLSKKYNCTRQNVNNICKRYMKKLIELLEKDNKLEELRQYL